MSRVGQFTSSSIYKLMSNGRGGFTTGNVGAPFHTYVKEKQYEIMMGRSLSTEVQSRPTSWGNLCEKRAFDLLPMNYILESKTRYQHKTIDRWSGMPDIVTNDGIVGDIKCPFTLKSAVELILSFNSVDEFKKHSPEYYWQLVSNKILTESDVCELHVYVPYKYELSEIRDMINDYNDPDELSWMHYVTDEHLPYFIEGKKFKNLTSFRFTPSYEDEQMLESRVLKALNLEL